MKVFLLTLLATFQMAGSACQAQSISKHDIKILKINQHPFLVDHGRMISVVGNEGTTLDSLVIYSDAGSGCQAFLFENSTSFTICDCNGSRFQIDKVSGLISREGWYWDEEIPDGYMGTFIFSSGTEYRLVKQEIDMSRFYNYKDPHKLD